MVHELLHELLISHVLTIHISHILQTEFMVHELLISHVLTIHISHILQTEFMVHELLISHVLTIHISHMLQTEGYGTPVSNITCINYTHITYSTN